MRRAVRRLTEDDLEQYPIRDLLEGWFFRVDEISQGCYQIEGINRLGRKVSRIGIAPDELLKLCIRDIEEMGLTLANHVKRHDTATK